MRGCQFHVDFLNFAVEIRDLPGQQDDLSLASDGMSAPCSTAADNGPTLLIYRDSAGTRTNRLPKREIGILLTE